MNDKNNSYLKTPAGLWTEVTLPLEAMYQDLKNDTLNSVSLKFTKYKETVENQDKTYKMGTPKYLLLVREDDMKPSLRKIKLSTTRLLSLVLMTAVQVRILF